MVAIEPRHSKFRYVAIQCADCGAVVGVQDYYNTAVKLFELATKLGVPLEQ